MKTIESAINSLSALANKRMNGKLISGLDALDLSYHKPINLPSQTFCTGDYFTFPSPTENPERFVAIVGAGCPQTVKVFVDVHNNGEGSHIMGRSAIPLKSLKLISLNALRCKDFTEEGTLFLSTGVEAIIQDCTNELEAFKALAGMRFKVESIAFPLRARTSDSGEVNRYNKRLVTFKPY